MPVSGASNHGDIAVVDHGNKRGKRPHLCRPHVLRTLERVLERAPEGVRRVLQRSKTNRPQSRTFGLVKLLETHHGYNRPVHATEHRGLPLLGLCACFVLSTLYVPSCYRNETEVLFYRYDGYTFSSSEQRVITEIAEAAVRDARVLLPDLPVRVIIRVHPGKKVIDELGSSSDHSLPNIIYWTVDPSRPGGATGVARTHLRATLFYHLHSLTRLARHPNVALMDHVVGMGMAAVFERDEGGRTYPWTQYPDDVAAWLAELLRLPPDANLDDWMHRHPDGRRWIGLRAGTYLVERAMKASRQSAAQLVSRPTADIVRLGTR